MNLSDFLYVVNGIPVFHDNSQLKEGFIYAVTCYVEDLYTHKRKYIICVDDLFINAPRKWQDFIIFHEVAHVIHKDCEFSLLRSILKLFNRNHNQKVEMNADLYAASAVGKDGGIEWLEYIRENYKINRSEIDARIINLRSVK